MERLVHVLLVEDNPADVDLARESFVLGGWGVELSVAVDGVEAIEFLARRGRYASVVLTSSDSDRDVLKSYQLGANCYLTKPVGLREFRRMVGELKGFWCGVVKLPRWRGGSVGEEGSAERP